MIHKDIHKTHIIYFVGRDQYRQNRVDTAVAKKNHERYKGKLLYDALMASKAFWFEGTSFEEEFLKGII